MSSRRALRQRHCGLAVLFRRWAGTSWRRRRWWWRTRNRELPPAGRGAPRRGAASTQGARHRHLGCGSALSGGSTAHRCTTVVQSYNCTMRFSPPVVCTRNRRTANRALRAYFTSMDKIRSVANARKVGNIIETDMVQRRRNKELKLNQIKNVVRSITNVGAMDILHGDGVPPGGKLL